ncbi:MAG: DUF5995 family protein [Bacteroidota bacterium]
MTTLAHTLEKMDAIVLQCINEGHRAGYFAVLYRYVTLRIKQGVDSGEFEDNARMERFDILFAQRFFDAWEAYFAGREATKSWQEAFAASARNNCMVMQHILLGINAHINLDLGIAASETMKGGSLLPLKNDFDKINRILISLVDEVKANIGKVSPILKWLIALARNKDEILLSFSIFAARDGAWKFALEHHHHPDPPASIRERDLKIARMAHSLAHPGRWLSFLTLLIRWGEYKPVARNIQIIGEVV